MKLLGFHKLKSLSSNSNSKSKSKSGTRNTEHANSNLENRKISVSQEYKAAIRTSSYEEMLSRVQIQLTRTSSNLLYSSSSSSSPPAKICTLHHLSDTVLEPSAETLDNMIKTLDLHHLIFNFFKASSEACNVCELLLRNIHTTRANYSSVKRAIELSRSMNNNNTQLIYSEEIRVELATFVSLSNPLGFISSAQFHNMHDDHVGLLHRLVKKRKKISRKIKTVKICKKAGRCCLVASCGVAGVVTLVVAAHTVVGIAVAPGILFSCALGLGFSEKPTGEVEEREGLCNGNRNGEKLRMQVDAAAKWMFILVNDMDTVVSLVEKIYGEIEHSRDRVDLGLKNEVVLREVMKELDEEKMCLMQEQLDELEQHIYLCLVTINKSRRSILDQTTSAAS